MWSPSGLLTPPGRGARCLAGAAAGPTSPAGAKPHLVAAGVGLVGLRAPGSTIDLANPSARVGDRYFRGSGTSMSTAVVAGAAARVAAAHPGWGPDRIKAALTGTADPLAQAGAGAGTLDLEAVLGLAAVPAANADLFPLRTVGQAATPTPPGPVAGLDWRAGGADGLRWAPVDGLPGSTPGADDTEAWTARPWLSGGWTAASSASKSWAAQQWLARAWAARRWAATGLDPSDWGTTPAFPQTPPIDWGTTPAVPQTPPAGTAGAVDWVARSWAERAWGPGDLAARSWAGLDWTAQSWAARRWTAGTWAARSWARRP